MDALASRYRPQVFREVFAQDYPVRVLSQLIKKGQRCLNILLYGSVGFRDHGCRPHSDVGAKAWGISESPSCRGANGSCIIEEGSARFVRDVRLRHQPQSPAYKQRRRDGAATFRHR